MTNFKDSIRLVSYNCQGWSSGTCFLNDSMLMVDICFLQEHWLFSNQLSLLNFNSGFTSHGVSGMNDEVLLRGCPYMVCVLSFVENLCVVIYVLFTHLRDLVQSN